MVVYLATLHATRVGAAPTTNAEHAQVARSSLDTNVRTIVPLVGMKSKDSNVAADVLQTVKLALTAPRALSALPEKSWIISSVTTFAQTH